MFIPQAARRFGLFAAKRINCGIFTVFLEKKTNILSSNKAYFVIIEQKYNYLCTK